jgi:hypothetical protein
MARKFCNAKQTAHAHTRTHTHRRWQKERGVCEYGKHARKRASEADKRQKRGEMSSDLVEERLMESRRVSRIDAHNLHQQKLIIGTTAELLPTRTRTRTRTRRETHRKTHGCVTCLRVRLLSHATRTATSSCGRTEGRTGLVLLGARTDLNLCLRLILGMVVCGKELVFWGGTRAQKKRETSNEKAPYFLGVVFEQRKGRRCPEKVSNPASPMGAVCLLWSCKRVCTATTGLTSRFIMRNRFENQPCASSLRSTPTRTPPTHALSCELSH